MIYDGDFIVLIFNHVLLIEVTRGVNAGPAGCAEAQRPVARQQWKHGHAI